MSGWCGIARKTTLLLHHPDGIAAVHDGSHGMMARDQCFEPVGDL
jgi:hypothetical protein